MKKIFSFVLAISFIFSLSGCTRIFGGNQRVIGERAYVITDGENDYWEVNTHLDTKYLKKSGNSFALNTDDLSAVYLDAKSDTEVVYSGISTELRGPGIPSNDEYSFLKDVLYQVTEGFKYFDFVVLKSNDELYGAVNCYSRVSGRSGNLLSVEDLTKSVLFDVEKELAINVKTLEGVAVLALNQTHYIGCENEIIYSFEKVSGNKKELFKDVWRNSNADRARVYFFDDFFVIYAKRYDSGIFLDRLFETVMVGSMDGSYFETLIDDELFDE